MVNACVVDLHWACSLMIGVLVIKNLKFSSFLVNLAILCTFAMVIWCLTISFVSSSRNLF